MSTYQRNKQHRLSVKKESITKEVKQIADSLQGHRSRKENITGELLKDLLHYATIASETNKSFAKLRFTNSNSYYGWLGSNGFNGFGTYIYADGTSLRGSFEAGLTKGLGRYNYSNGSTYQGAFLAGRSHGYGQYKTKRFQYHGYFRSGKFHGQGVWKSKTEQQEGIFIDGKLSQGEVRDSSGVFNGTFDESGFRNHGKFTFKNGNTYSGSWTDDCFNGFGVYNWVEEGCPITRSETKYIGNWLNGKRSGLGMLIFRQRCIICQWCGDRKSGAGVIVACNGNCYAGAEMFHDNQYIASYQIELCKQSRDILCQIARLTSLNEADSTTAFLDKVRELIDGRADSACLIYPIRIPHYEIGSLPQGLELRCLQQVVSENYKDFMGLYKKYTHATDEYMNNLGLNLFFMDVFHKIKEVNVADFTEASNHAISHPRTYVHGNEKSCSIPLAPVPFNEFLRHFFQLTEALMANEQLNMAVEKLRPTFFGQRAIQTLYVLKMLQEMEAPKFLVREAQRVNRPAVLALITMMKDHSPGDNSIRCAYRFLRAKGVVSGTSYRFLEAVARYYQNVIQENILCEIELNVSDLELVEIVLDTCQLVMKELRGP